MSTGSVDGSVDHPGGDGRLADQRTDGHRREISAEPREEVINLGMNALVFACPLVHTIGLHCCAN